MINGQQNTIVTEDYKALKNLTDYLCKQAIRLLEIVGSVEAIRKG